MKIKREIKNNCQAVKFIVEEDGQVMGRAYLYLIQNDLHKEPYGLLEDVFVDEQFRGNGTGTMLVKAAIEEAKKKKCYKLVGTSRESRKKVHGWYKKFGFEDYGREFRLNIK